jgi:zinc protease
VALVLVGDVTAEAVLPVLERSFGSLPADRASTAGETPAPGEAGGARRVQATLPGAPRLLMGWRLPPRGHADHLGMRVLARLLAGGPGSRLRWGPLEPRGILASLDVAFGVPGARDGGLLVFEATPGEGHGLAEAEQAITSEILRVQQDPIQDEEILGAQRRVLLEGLEAQEDAATFAAALGEAWSQAGRWQLGLTDPARVKAWGSDELRRLARTWLSLDRAVTVLAEPDPLTAEEDPLDGRLIEALRTMARARMDDPAAVDALVRGTIRQLRMLPRVERERVLELLRTGGRP